MAGIYITNFAKTRPHLPLIPSCICSPTTCHSQKPQMLFLCLDASLKMYRSFVKMLHKLKFLPPLWVPYSWVLPCICMSINLISLVNLSFARGALAKNLERENKQLYFSSTLSSTLSTSDPVPDKLQQPHLDCLISFQECPSHTK